MGKIQVLVIMSRKWLEMILLEMISHCWRCWRWFDNMKKKISFLDPMIQQFLFWNWSLDIMRLRISIYILRVFTVIFNYEKVSMMANFMSVQGVQIFGRTLCRVCPWGCFWMRLTFKSVDLSKADCSSHCVWGLIQSVEGLNRTKSLHKGQFILSAYL